MGAFDDLIPQKSSGNFDDLIPQKISQTPIDDVPQWGRGEVGANLYGMYGAIREVPKEVIPYAKYLYPEVRKEFMQKSTKEQTDELLWDTVNAELFVGFPNLIKGVSNAVAPAVERISPKLYQALTKERSIFPKKQVEVIPETKTTFDDLIPK